MIHNYRTPPPRFGYARMYEVLNPNNDVFDQQSFNTFQATGPAQEVSGKELTQRRYNGTPVLNTLKTPNKDPYDTSVYFRIPAVSIDTGKKLHIIAPFDGSGKSALTQKLDIVG